jgi:Polyketide cyclase / dehydrase and lipid transport
MLRRVIVGMAFIGLLAVMGLALLRDGNYGWALFIVIPIFLGGAATYMYGPASAWGAIGVGAFGPCAAAFCLLVLGTEGLGCILMCLPLAAPLGAFGGWIVYSSSRSRVAAGGGVAMLLLSPASLIFDTHATPDIFQVHSSITIAAPPEVVWKHVVSFSDLPEPDEWYFRAGLAYPKRARIEGTGAGAVRYCEFSTGPFVEPITVWDEPNLLHFRVAANPEPMHEWSPYAHVLPKHLHGYLISKQGEFRLTRLPGNQTLLEGTTWYQHGLWPAEYWRWWSQAIIHRIHMRVLNHIRVLAEAPGQAGFR